MKYVFKQIAGVYEIFWRGIVNGCWVCSLPCAGKNCPCYQNINEHGNVQTVQRFNSDKKL
jgi:hypothetical protein